MEKLSFAPQLKRLKRSEDGSLYVQEDEDGITRYMYTDDTLDTSSVVSEKSVVTQWHESAVQQSTSNNDCESAMEISPTQAAHRAAQERRIA